MADINTSRTFVAGDIVDAAAMNNIIDQAAILEAFISGKTPVVTPSPTDNLVISNGTILQKTPYGTKVSSVSLTMPAPFAVGGSPVTGAGTLAVTLPAQSGNVFFCSPIFGVSGAPLFRHIVAQDTVLDPANIAAWSIDWRLNTNFYKTIVADGAFLFFNPIEGQQINVLLANTGPAHTITWPTAKWKGGVVPTLTPTPNHADIFHFYYQGGLYFGWADQNFF